MTTQNVISCHLQQKQNLVISLVFLLTIPYMVALDNKWLCEFIGILLFVRLHFRSVSYKSRNQDIINQAEVTHLGSQPANH